MIKIEINPSSWNNFERYMKALPKRTQWAMKESLSMAGGHLRKKLRDFIEGGGEGWPPLSGLTLRTPKKQGGPSSPLHGFGKYVRFKVSGVKKIRLRVGFLTGERYSKFVRGAAKKMETGKEQRVTDKIRRKLAAMGVPLRGTTKKIKLPRRPMVSYVYEREAPSLPDYIEKSFFKKFYSGEGPQA